MDRLILMLSSYILVQPSLCSVLDPASITTTGSQTTTTTGLKTEDWKIHLSLLIDVGETMDARFLRYDLPLMLSTYNWPDDVVMDVIEIRPGLYDGPIIDGERLTKCYRHLLTGSSDLDSVRKVIQNAHLSNDTSILHGDMYLGYYELVQNWWKQNSITIPDKEVRIMLLITNAATKARLRDLTKRTCWPNINETIINLEEDLEQLYEARFDVIPAAYLLRQKTTTRAASERQSITKMMSSLAKRDFWDDFAEAILNQVSDGDGYLRLLFGALSDERMPDGLSDEDFIVWADQKDFQTYLDDIIKKGKLIKTYNKEGGSGK